MSNFTHTPNSVALQNTLGPECPRAESMRISVVFLRMLFGNNRNVVTSLVAAPNSPIIVRSCCGGTNTKTGDLEVGLNLNLTATGNVNGGTALKQITADNKFKYGWVTEGVVSASPQILVQGYNTDGAQRALTVTEKANLGFTSSDVVYAQQGLVKLTYSDALTERELAPQIIRLSDVAERLYHDVPYLGFIAGQESLLRARFVVPAAGLGNSVKLKFRAQLLGLVNGQLPNLVATYRIIPRPTAINGGTPTVTLPQEADEKLLSFASGVSVSANEIIEIESAQFSIAEGDTVLVTLIRQLENGGPDAYPGEVGLLRLSGIVTNT
jgi:hypothetical protein